MADAGDNKEIIKASRTTRESRARGAEIKTFAVAGEG